MMALRARVRSERGSALVTSLLVMGIMLSIALPLMSIVDTQQRVTSAARLHESSFNLTDAVLNAQVFVLSNSWPATVDQRYDPCTQDGTSLKCPDPVRDRGHLLGCRLFTGHLARPGARRRRDAPTTTTSAVGSTASRRGTPTRTAALGARRRTWDGKDQLDRDAGADDRARRDVPPEHRDGRPLRPEEEGEEEGDHHAGQRAQPAAIAVRCTGGYGSACLNYKPKKKWLMPNIVQTGYVGQRPSPAAIDRLRLRAKVLGTLLRDGCPTSPEGPLVFVESGDCVYVGGKGSRPYGTRVKGGRVEVNSPTAPGVFVIASGSVTLRRN